MADTTDNNGKKTRFSICSQCKRQIQWAPDPETGKYKPFVPGSTVPHKCRQIDYGQPPKTREGYI